MGGGWEFAYLVVTAIVLIAYFFKDREPSKMTKLALLGGWTVILLNGFLFGLIGVMVIKTILDLVVGAGFVGALFFELWGGIPGVNLPDIAGAVDSMGGGQQAAPPQAQAPPPQAHQPPPQAHRPPPQAQGYPPQPQYQGLGYLF